MRQKEEELADALAEARCKIDDLTARLEKSERLRLEQEQLAKQRMDEKNETE